MGNNREKGKRLDEQKSRNILSEHVTCSNAAIAGAHAAASEVDSLGLGVTV
jgi:hypothetical protein